MSPDVSTLRTTSKNGSRYRTGVISRASSAVAVMEASERERSLAESTARPIASCAFCAGGSAVRRAMKASKRASWTPSSYASVVPYNPYALSALEAAFEFQR